jgi:phage FluMu gp28-like protein
MNLHPPFRPSPVARDRQASTGAVEFARERLSFQADPKQALVLESDAKRGILLCSRQWGKSTVSAVRVVHRAATVAGSLVVVASPSERQSAEWVRKAAGFVRRLGMRAKGDGDNAQSLVFPNGSRIVGLPGNDATVRGFSAVSLLLIDEAARVTDELYKSLRPMLAASRGDLWLMSTPFGKRGFFYDEWAEGGSGWERVSGPATECSRIDAAFLDDERRALGESWFAQEYLCEFVDNGENLFPRDLVESAVTRDVEALF